MPSTTGTDLSSSSSSSSTRSAVTSVTSTTSLGAGSTSTRGTSTSTPKTYESQLLLSPSFLTCAGAILFRGIPPLPPAVVAPATPQAAAVDPALATRQSSWTPPSPPSLSSSSPSSSPAPRHHLLRLAADRIRFAEGTSERVIGDDDEDEDDEQTPPTPSSASMAAPGLQVCIIYHQRKNEYILAKGRKDQFETGMLETAMRETHEETGYPCRPFPVTLTTRAPIPGADIKDSPDGLPVADCTEPFALTLRTISSTNVKLIYWFLAEATSSFADENTRMPSENAFTSCWFGPEEAAAKLTHEHDRNVMRQAIGLVRAEIARRSCASSIVVDDSALASNSKKLNTDVTTPNPVPAPVSHSAVAVPRPGTAI